MYYFFNSVIDFIHILCTGLELIKVRGKAMQHASEITPSGMMSVFLNRESKLKFACHVARMYCKEKLGMDNPVCTIANYLYPECKVIAGNIEVRRLKVSI